MISIHSLVEQFAGALYAQPVDGGNQYHVAARVWNMTMEYSVPLRLTFTAHKRTAVSRFLHYSAMTFQPRNSFCASVEIFPNCPKTKLTTNRKLCTLGQSVLFLKVSRVQRTNNFHRPLHDSLLGTQTMDAANESYQTIISKFYGTPYLGFILSQGMRYKRARANIPEIL